MPVTRRQLGKIAAAGAITMGSPLGLFFGSRAEASVPGGDYLNKMSEDQFWFRSISQFLTNDEGLPDPNADYWLSADGQLTARLGISGGFAIGYFSTLTFLSEYRSQAPDHYRDLLINASKTPAETREASVLRRLKTHRLFFEQNIKRNSSRFIAIDAARTAMSEKSRIATPFSVASTDARLTAPQRTTRALEDLVTEDLKTSMVTAASFGREKGDLSNLRAEFLTTTSNGLTDEEVNVDLSTVLQDRVNGLFSLENEFFMNDVNAVRTDRLVEYADDGNLYIDKFTDAGGVERGFVHPQALQSAVPVGMKKGQLAAFAYFALLEARQIIRDTKVDSVEEVNADSSGTRRLVENADQALFRYSEASSLLEAFG